MLEQKTYKNYKELCKAMNWSTTGGNTKTKYLKELTSICKWHKEGNKIVIDEIYEEQKKIVDNRGNNGSNPKYLFSVLPLLDEYILKISEGKEGQTITTSINGIINYIFNVNEIKIMSTIEYFKKTVPNEVIPKSLLNFWCKQIKNDIKSLLYGVINKSTIKLLQGEKYKDYTVVADTLNIVTTGEDRHHYYNNKSLVEKYTEHKELYAHTYGVMDDNMFNATNEQWKQCNMIFLSIPSIRFMLDKTLVNELDNEEVYLDYIQVQYTITKNTGIEKMDERDKKVALYSLKTLVYEKIGNDIQKIKIEDEYPQRYELGFKISLATKILDYMFLNIRPEAKNLVEELYKTIDELKKENSALKAENQMLKNKLQNQQN